MASNADRQRYIQAWMTDTCPPPAPAHFHATRETIYFYGRHYPLLRAFATADAYYLNETHYSNSTTSAQNSARAALEAEGYSLVCHGSGDTMTRFSVWRRR